MKDSRPPDASPSKRRWILIALGAMATAVVAGVLLARTPSLPGREPEQESTAALEIQPRPARTHHELRVAGRLLRTLRLDDRDEAGARLVWSVNGEDVGTGPALPAGSFRRGDRVRVRVEVPGPERTLVTAEDSIVIANSPPHVRTARLERDRSRPHLLNLRFDAGDPDADALDHQVHWRLDGQPWTGAHGTQVDVSALGRGSRVTARVQVDDGESTVESAEVAFVLDNRPPSLEIGREPRVERDEDGGQRAVLTARSADPDGDPVRIRAVDAPAGVEWNASLGALVWAVDQGTERFDVILSAEDDRGGRAERTITLAR